MEQERLANKMLTFQENVEAQVPWLKEVHQNLEICMWH